MEQENDSEFLIMSKHIFPFLKEGTKIVEKEGIITGKWAGLHRRKLHRLIVTMHFNYPT